MTNITLRQQNIIKIMLRKGKLQSSAIHQELISSGESISLVSIKRALSEMVKNKLLETSRSGRYIVYEISTRGRIFADINSQEYLAVEPDNRFGLDKYNFDLLKDFPNEIFNQDELSLLNNATRTYHKRIKDISNVIAEKELLRLIIELSWKSSKIEGNTYTLLDTENLILKNKEAVGHEKDEATMILNHKDAFLFIRNNETEFKKLNSRNLEALHTILIKDLGVNKGLRKGLVGITGSKYRPLENIYQIKEAIEELGKTISRSNTVYEKALLALVGISYIQPFEDGNKRTGRLMANALLLSHGHAPLSYRSINEEEYRSAILAFYEINTIVPFKKIFIDQYLFAANNYAVK